MIDNLKIDTQPLVSGNFCTDCEHSVPKGQKEHGEEFYALFCISPDVVVKTQNYAEGEEYTWARRCRVYNNAGNCAYYSAK